MSESITESDVQIIQSIIGAFYGKSHIRKFSSTTITNETVFMVVQLLSEASDCSMWIDAVPSPQELLMPASKLRKWALRVIRKSGDPFLTGNVQINLVCQRFRAAQFKPVILNSLN